MATRFHSRWIGRIALLLASLLLVLAAGEGVARLVGRLRGIDLRLYARELGNPDRLPRGLTAPDPLLGIRLRPGFEGVATTPDFSVVYRINSRGLRDAEHAYAKPAEGTRILAFGDSFTFGEGVPYGRRFTEVLERAVPDLEVLNFGVPGYGIDQELVYFATEGVRYEADWVFVFVNLIDAARFNLNLVREDGRVVLPETATAAPGSGPDASTVYVRDEEVPGGADRFLLRHSHLLSYVYYRIEVLRLGDGLRERDAGFWRAMRNRLRDIRRTGSSERIRARTRRLLEKFAEVARERGMRLAVVNIDDYDPMPYLGEDTSFAYHSLTADLKRRARRRRLTFVYDAHFNPETHELIGRKLVPFVERTLRGEAR